jgi:hypothetical protein
VEIDYRGSRAAADQRKRAKEEGSAGLVSGFSPCLRSNQIRQLVDLWQDFDVGLCLDTLGKTLRSVCKKDERGKLKRQGHGLHGRVQLRNLESNGKV